MAHKTEFKHKACGTELRMDVDLEDHFYRAPTEVTKIYCPTCKSVFATNAFEWLDGSGPVVPGAPDNTLPGDLPEGPNNELPETGEEAPVDPDYGVPSEKPDQGLPGEQPGVDNELPDRERPVDPGYGVGIEHPDQSPPAEQPGVDNELPAEGKDVNLNPDLNPDLGRQKPDGPQPKK